MMNFKGQPTLKSSFSIVSVQIDRARNQLWEEVYKMNICISIRTSTDDGASTGLQFSSKLRILAQLIEH